MELLYVIPETERNAAGLRKCLPAHPEIRFASLTGVDLGGNDTDEKIPIGHFLAHIEEFLSGGVQTDGSSVVRPGIAALNDGKVDLIADSGVRWYVDYNQEHMNSAHGFPVGTLRIPSYLKHRNRLIDSRAILKRAVESIGKRLSALFGSPPATVWETLRNLELHPQKVAALQADDVFSPEVLNSYHAAMLLHWLTELSDRVAPENAKAVHACVRLPGENRLDAQRWEKIQTLKEDLARDDVGRVSVFHRIRAAAASRDFPAVSALQLEMAAKMNALTDLYRSYRQNMEPA